MEYAVERYLTIGLALSFLYNRAEKSTRYIYRQDFEEGDEEHLLPEGKVIRVTLEYIDEDETEGVYSGDVETVESYKKG